jgi:hypothetical protein
VSLFIGCIPAGQTLDPQTIARANPVVSGADVARWARGDREEPLFAVPGPATGGQQPGSAERGAKCGGLAVKHSQRSHHP